MLQVVILAGGLGTRLGKISESIPKSLIEINGKPVLSHILEWVHQQGCREALILTGHLGEMFENFTHDGMSLRFHQENVPLGTGGALWNAREYLQDEFILLWGDDFHPIDYGELIATHRENKARLTMTVTESHLDVNLKHELGKVIAYSKEKNDSGFNGYEAGTSVVSKSIVETYGQEGKWSWEKTIYPTLAGEIVAHFDETAFWDIGTPERITKLENFFKQGGA
ncbi:MAG: sugar phosphate nucleotidyltransferase [Candidatus Thermoplasmatota archaeon]|nr:sugar phosphate nucleotidyltransferase [Candidatus Thermoplasmatota archaeon]